MGEEKTFSRVRDRFYWPGYHKDVCKWCQACPDYATAEAKSHSNRAPLQDRQKAHGKAYAQNDLVWVHSKVIPQCVSRKLHRPWKGPYRILKQLSDSVYRLQNPRLPPIIHFDRLKPCPPTIRLEHVRKSRPAYISPSNTPAGTHLQLLEDDNDATAQPIAHQRRYLAFERRPAIDCLRMRQIIPVNIPIILDTSEKIS